jgi:hypothetical protein
MSKKISRFTFLKKHKSREFDLYDGPYKQKKENDEPKAKEAKQSTGVNGAMGSPVRDASTSSGG